MTPSQKFLESLTKFKASGGTIDDAIALVNCFLIENEKKHIIEAYYEGVRQSDSYLAINKKQLDGETFYQTKYTKK